MANDQGKKPVVHTRKHIARLERERRQSRMILYVFLGILAVVIMLLLYGYVDLNYLQANRPVAKVADTEIISSQFEARVRLQRRQLLSQYSQMLTYQQFGFDVNAQLEQITASLSSPESVGESVLNQMIDEEIVRQEAAKRGITVSPEEVDLALQEAFGFYADGTPTPTLTPTLVLTPTIPAQAFDIVTMTPSPSPSLASNPTEGADSGTTGTPNPTATSTPAPSNTPTATAGPTFTPEPTATPYTFEGFETEYADTIDVFADYGFNEEQYRRFFETQLLRNKLFEEITADVPHAEERVWARHILVEDEETAKSVLDRINNGEDFATLAAELSQDPGSGVQGGDLGWFGRGAMVAPFEEAAFSLQAGEISDPVQSDFGYHIIQVIARQEQPLSAEEYSQKAEQVFSDFLAAAREELVVEIYDLWRERVPTEPNFDTMATESADAQKTALAETADAPTATPTP